VRHLCPVSAQKHSRLRCAETALQRPCRSRLGPRVCAINVKLTMGLARRASLLVSAHQVTSPGFSRPGKDTRRRTDWPLRGEGWGSNPRSAPRDIRPASIKGGLSQSPPFSFLLGFSASSGYFYRGSSGRSRSRKPVEGLAAVGVAIAALGRRTLQITCLRDAGASSRRGPRPPSAASRPSGPAPSGIDPDRRVSKRDEAGYQTNSSELRSSLKIFLSNRHSSRCPAV
jgi:hypothetical protein